MRLSWNEIRARAARFADDWASAQYEKGETQSFYNEFFDVFGVQRRKVATFEEPVKKLGDKRGFIDLFWKGVLLIEQKSAGRDLVRAKAQALDYFPGLKDAEYPRYILVSDFQNFELYDLEERTEQRFRLAELPQRVEFFTFILGVEKKTFRDQDPVNIKASELMGRLHDALKASGYEGHDLERLLVRLVFCLFADSTGIFERDSFLDLVTERSQVDGSDIGRLLIELFDVLNTPDFRRQKKLEEDLASFPYVNGELFAERLPTPAFDAKMRALLMEACEFKWDAISPAIFGSLFQSVMNANERRTSGAHYTTEKNIMKVIEPLFLEELRAEFERMRARRDTGRVNALNAFHEKLAKLTFFDPACGCGNFLIISYRELRTLEIDLLHEIFPKGQRVLDVAGLSKLNVNQFYGIEISEFPARIAEVALWMMDHIMNNRLSLEFGEAYARIPLKVSPHIHHADALDLDWCTVLAPEDCDFVLGNPPFSGFVMREEAKQNQTGALLRSLGALGSRLDYVAAWFLKAGQYVQSGDARIGFVATNSITQGEQASLLWPALFDRWKLEIAFAHRTFAWGSDARGMAHVHVVIIGLTKRENEKKEKQLFSYGDINGDPVRSLHEALSPYLFDASKLLDRHLVVRRTRDPSDGIPTIRVGCKPVDGGYLIMDDAEREEFLNSEPEATPLLRPFVGSEELINGGARWILVLHSVPPQRLRALPAVMELVDKVRRYRLGELPHRQKSERANKKASALSLNLAKTPTEFDVTVLPETAFLAIPEVSSERREYIPIAWLTAPTVPSNKLLVATGVSLHHFALLMSKMHVAWAAYVGGRLKSDYQYSSGINYNPFPWPSLDEGQKNRLSVLAQAVLDLRTAHPDATLADLYDPDVMPPDLRRAHHAIDVAVDKLYRVSPFDGDRARVEHLFSLYEKSTAPLLPGADKPKRSRKRAAA